MKANRAFHDDDAVSDVIGTILMVSITVGMMVGLSILVMSFEGPGDTLYADMQVDISPGDLSWGDGNEAITLLHLGGEPLLTDDARILVSIDGATTTFIGSALGGDFQDGAFDIGDEWSVDNMTIPGNARIEVNVIDNGLNQVIASNILIADLSLASAVPPVTTYATEYYINGAGTVSNFPNAQSASDGGAAAELDETSSPGGSATTPHISPSAVDDSNGVTGPSNTLFDDQVYTEMADLADRVAVDGFTVPADVATITGVRIGFEARQSGGGGNDPQVRLTYSNVPLSVPSTQTFTVTDNLDTEFELSVTGDKVAWTKSDIESMIVTVERMSANGGYPDADIDHIWVELEYIQVAQWDLDIMLNFTGIPLGTIHEVQLRYDAPTDDYSLQVWNGASWTVRGSLTASTNSLFTYRLTVSEYNGGEPRLRLVDMDDQVGQGHLNIDYARVQTV